MHCIPILSMASPFPYQIFFILYLFCFCKASCIQTGIVCSNQSIADDRVQFELALETLLLRLRAEVNIRRVSTGEIRYGNSSTIYGSIKCFHLVSSKECDVCVSKGIEMLYKNCGGQMRASVNAQHCFVGYHGYQFFLHIGVNGSDSDNRGELIYGNGSAGVGNLECEKSDSMSLKVKIALIWVAAFVFLFGVVLLAGLMRRSIVTTAKVTTF